MFHFYYNDSSIKKIIVQSVVKGHSILNNGKSSEKEEEEEDIDVDLVICILF
uniref:Uncharacterized protein n=1 Tax=Rhizophagus irregularis (strain DAOM 181602 / DAOM 197198 / MUCL 43194) TaxID=747089 RepID=U9V5S4_RHIID